MALLLCLALQETRVTLELRDVPLGVAAGQALAPFGDHARWVPIGLAFKKVDLRLRDAAYLEVLDALGELTGAGAVRNPRHLLLSGEGNECVTCDNTPVPIVRDLTPSLRLFEQHHPDAGRWTSLAGPPGTPPPRLSWNDVPRRRGHEGDPAVYEVLWPASGGEMLLADGRRVEFPAAPRTETPKPVDPPRPLPLVPLLFVALGLAALVAIFSWPATSRRS